MNCSYCHKRIRFEERVFWLYNEPLHEKCLARVKALERKKAKLEKEQREQTKLEGVYRWLQ